MLHETAKRALEGEERKDVWNKLMRLREQMVQKDVSLTTAYKKEQALSLLTLNFEVDLTTKKGKKKRGDKVVKRMNFMESMSEVIGQDAENGARRSFELCFREVVKADHQNLLQQKLVKEFTNDLEEALIDADLIMFCTAHQHYIKNLDQITSSAYARQGLFDGCNLLRPNQIKGLHLPYAGIGKGKTKPDKKLIDGVLEMFKGVERGVANEVLELIFFYNDHYVKDPFNKADFSTVQTLAATCSTGCKIVDPVPIRGGPSEMAFHSQLADLAFMTCKQPM